MASRARVEQKSRTPIASSNGGRGSGKLVAKAVRATLAAPRSGDDLEHAKAAITHGSGGRPLDRSTRSLMEGRFGHDFGGVRVHTDARAARSARELGARAYTIGSDIAFGTQQYAPHTTAGQRLLAHELAHVIQRAPGVARQPVGGQVVEDPAERAAERAATSVLEGPGPLLVATTAAPSAAPGTQLGPGWATVNQLGIVRVAEEPEPTSIGARLRAAPASDATVLQELGQNAKVFVLAENKADARVHVQTLEGGQRGFIADWLVWYPLPDPQAVLYYVAKEGLGLQQLVENHPQYKGYDIRTGDDARSLVMAVLTANDQDSRTRGHVYLNEKKLAEARDPGTLEELKDVADEYRAVLRPILQSVELQRFEKIWLPGPAYVRSLQQSGLIPTRPEWKNAAIAITKGIGGFLAGLVSGFVSSVLDVFIDVYELVKMVISKVIDLITGELLNQAQELYDQLDDLSPKQLLDLLVNAVTQAVGGMFNDFVNRWTQNNLYEKWYFRGSVVGYVLAEVLMAIFTGGAATAVKWLSKLGKLGAKLAKILVKVMGTVDKALDVIPGRTKRAKPDVDKDIGSDRAKQLPLAMALSSTITEAHDRADSPIPVLGASLLPLKLKYRWITAFRAIPTGPGEYRIVMVASDHTIDTKYTTGAGKESTTGDQDITQAKQPAAPGVDPADAAADQYRRNLVRRYPRLADAQLGPIRRNLGEPGLWEESIYTGSGRRSWSARLRDGHGVQLDDIDPRGFVVDTKMRGIGAGREIPPERTPDVTEKLRGGPARGPQWDPFPEREQTKLLRQLRFARENGLAGVRWETNSAELKAAIERYAKTVLTDEEAKRLVVELVER